jgi:hypothetical protein
MVDELLFESRRRTEAGILPADRIRSPLCSSFPAALVFGYRPTPLAVNCLQSDLFELIFSK